MAENEALAFNLRLEKYSKYLCSKTGLIVFAIVVIAIWIPEPPLWERTPSNLAQILLDSIFTGSTYVLLAIGLTLVYRILRFANFAHAEFVTFGAYMAFLVFVVSNSLGLDVGQDILWGVLAAFVLTGLLGIASDKIVFGQLRKRKAEAFTIMISSIGVGLIIRHLIQEVWTGASVWYDPTLPEWLYELHGLQLLPRNEGTQNYLLFNITVRRIGEIIAYDIDLFLFTLTITPIKLFVIFCSCFLVLACHLLFTQTKLGKAMRATSDNPDLAQAAGIDINRVILLVWFLGAGLAGAGGVLSIVAMRRINPDTGFKLLLVAFAVVILGGIGSYYGAVLAAYIMGFAENFGVLLLNGLSVKYEQCAGFLHGEEWKDFFYVGNFHIHLKLPFGLLPFNLYDILPLLEKPFGYKPAISFAILIIALLLKPLGLFGLPERAE